MPHAGPHGLDIDVAHRRLFCACDAAVLVEVDADTGTVLTTHAIAGVPDVVFFNAALARLYVAIGDPGVIEVFDTTPLRHAETVSTERGAHTLAFDASRNIVCAFLPASHRAAVYEDRPEAAVTEGSRPGREPSVHGVAYILPMSPQKTYVEASWADLWPLIA